MSSLPFLGVYMQLQNWIFGSVMCKLVGSVYYLGLYSSVLFLALLTFDRHLAVVYSLGLRQVRNTNYALVSCFVVWLVSGLACISPMILQNAFVFRISNTTYCEDHPFNLDPTFVYHLRTSTYYMQFFLFFIFPLVVIVYCYVRIAITVMSSRIVIKVKTVRLIFIIVLLFFICWTPYNIHLLMSSENSSCEEMQRRGYVRHITRNIAYFYFFISPIFYTFVGRKFQNHFRQLLVRRFPKLKKHISVSENSRTNISTKGTHASTGNPNARLNSATVDFSSDTYLPPLTLPVHDRLQPTCINHNANRFPIQSKIVSGWYSNQPHTYC